MGLKKSTVFNMRLHCDVMYDVEINAGITVAK